jgi:hypothetical protein
MWVAAVKAGGDATLADWLSGAFLVLQVVNMVLIICPIYLDIILTMVGRFNNKVGAPCSLSLSCLALSLCRFYCARARLTAAPSAGMTGAAIDLRMISRMRAD